MPSDAYEPCATINFIDYINIVVDKSGLVSVLR